MNLTDIGKNFSTAAEAREFLEKLRWPDGVVCPHCGVVGESFRLESKDDSKNTLRDGVWKCGGCRKPFTVTVGTIFEDSHIPLNKWLMAIHLLCASKKGMSAHQLHRMLGISYKTAWFMAHRIRHAMAEEAAEQFGGTVEIDETYIGGKRKLGPHAAKPGERQSDRPGPFAGKEAVVSVLQRGGKVRSRHVQYVTAKNLKPIVDEVVSQEAKVMTDTGSILHGALMGRKHYQVNHRNEEYVRREDGVLITTNAVEGYFANLKRGIGGVYHHVGKHHLHRYLSEFDFRYNRRWMNDGERTLGAIKRTEGKRLKYRETKIRKNNYQE